MAFPPFSNSYFAARFEQPPSRVTPTFLNTPFLDNGNELFPTYLSQFNVSMVKSQSAPILKKFLEEEDNEVDASYIEKLEQLKNIRRMSFSRFNYSIFESSLTIRNNTDLFTTDAQFSIISKEHLPKPTADIKFNELTHKTLQSWPVSTMLCQPQHGCFSHDMISEMSLVPITVPVSQTNKVAKVKGIIAANYISISHFPNIRLISTEYPFHDSADSVEQPELFWRMALEQKIGLIVDLSFAHSVSKPYYPKEGLSLQFGSMTIVRTTDDSHLTSYLITDNKTGKTQTIQRLNVDDWYSAVFYNSVLLDALVCEIVQALETKGVIIHCNMGIGKSGVVICALNLFEFRNKLLPPFVSIEQAVDKSILEMRLQQSPKSVSTPLMRQQLITLLTMWQPSDFTDV